MHITLYLLFLIVTIFNTIFNSLNLSLIINPLLHVNSVKLVLYYFNKD